MKSPFSFDGEIGRRDYIVLSLTGFFSQHLLVAGAFAIAHKPMPTPWYFWFNPLRVTLDLRSDILPPWLLLIGMIAATAVSWMLVALAFRRSQNAPGGVEMAGLAIAPVFQIATIVWLSLAPRRAVDAPLSIGEKRDYRRRAAVQGLLLAVAMSVAAVFVSAVVLRLYGYGLFLASPFVIGLTTAYLGNRGGDIGWTNTFVLVFGGLWLGAVALVGLAFEGLICLILASPLIAIMGVIGGLFGLSLSRLRRPSGRSTLMSVAVVPILLAGEVVLPPQASFESVESIDIAASPAAVWDSIVHMGPIPDAPAAPFRWGLAYPMRGEIFGSGVGAVRRGVFSTGVAYERVTEWTPKRKLSFIVLSDPPTMRELSPYAHVNAPHVSGYFRTLDARFTITPLNNGKTRLTLTTQHEMDLEPALYWAPIAQWATHANKVRVLGHFRAQAEANGRPG